MEVRLYRTRNHYTLSYLQNKYPEKTISRAQSSGQMLVSIQYYGAIWHYVVTTFNLMKTNE